MTNQHQFDQEIAAALNSIITKGPATRPCASRSSGRDGNCYGEKLLTDQNPWMEAIPSRPIGFREFLAGMKGRRAFTSHLPYPLMPGVDSPLARIVYVARNPKDTAVS